jgi:methionyl-tRNA formyltransferase
MKGLSVRPEIVFMGTPDFAVPALDQLIRNGHAVRAVVTQPDRPKGRGRKSTPSPVKRVATQYGLKVLQHQKVSDTGFSRMIRDMKPDLLIVVAFGQILRKGLLDLPSWGALNIHASLLPKYRGAAPIQWAIINSETKTGLSAMRMDEGLDTGPVLFQEEVEIGLNETAGELHDRLAILAGKFLLTTLHGLATNQVDEKPQDSHKATYAPKIERSLSFIRWDQPARVISALIRGLDPWPGAVTSINGKDIKLFSSTVTDQDQLDGVPGRVLGPSRSGLLVQAGRGIIEVKEMQIPGKKRLPAYEFLRGFSIKKGTLLGR